MLYSIVMEKKSKTIFYIIVVIFKTIENISRIIVKHHFAIIDFENTCCDILWSVMSWLGMRNSMSL